MIKRYNISFCTLQLKCIMNCRFLCFSERWTRLMRSNAWQRYFCNYFPIKLVKTTDLDPTKSYLFCSFPHGILSTGVFGAFGTEHLNCKKVFPGLDFRVVILEQHFKIPFFREYAYMGGTYR